MASPTHRPDPMPSGAGAREGRRPGPGERGGGRVPADVQARRRQVLTQERASVVRSIADAVVIKDGEPFLLCPPDGQIPLEGEHGYGLYHHDCRFLSGHRLTLGGQPPEPLAATAATGTVALLQLMNPDLPSPDGPIPRECLAVRWERHLDGRGPALDERITVRSYLDRALELPLRIELRAGFEDVFAIRGLLDLQPGERRPAAWEGDALVFRYRGGDRLERRLRATFDPAPRSREGGAAEFPIRLAPRGEASVSLRLEVEEEVLPGGRPIARRERPDDRSSATHAFLLDRDRVDGGWAGGEPGWTARIRTDSLLTDAILARSLDDLRLLRSRLDGLRYYEAGVPWFATLFGRDAILVALQTLPFEPSIAADTLRLLAREQGRRDDAWRDEERGKILHELRIGELARLDEIPHTPFYGTVDATPLFLVLLARHAAWTGRLDLFRELREPVQQALDWIDRGESAGPGGFLAYAGEEGDRLVNQGWKDSGDAIVDADGRIARPPIALSEVQGYVHLARTEMAALLRRAGEPEAADRQERAAEALRERFERDFWDDDLGTYLLARQADGRPCAVVSSNAGQVLWSGIAAPERARRTAERLLRDDMWSGWGIRTLSAGAAAYNPLGYHLGTVWPHDNALIGAGFRRHGLDAEAERILRGLVEAAADFEHRRLPECFSGHPRDEFGVPVRYPVACHPQAWAAGAVPQLLVEVLGLVPEAFEGRLRVVRPRLPAFLDRVELDGLPVGGGRASLRFVRDGGRTRVEADGDGVTVDIETDDGRGGDGARGDGRERHGGDRAGAGLERGGTGPSG